MNSHVRLEKISQPQPLLGDGMRCLVVEDEPLLRTSLVKLLERDGFELLAAGSGLEALELLDQAAVPLLISDIRMPGMDGVELLREVRRRWPDTMVIMITAVAEVDTAVDCLRYGAFDYITKPFQIEEVRVRVAQVLERRRLIAENERYQADLAELVKAQANRIDELFLEGVQTLVHALEAKDAYTMGHSARVSEYAVRTARALGLSEVDCKLTSLGAELHDVGKIGVHESVLFKPSPLTREEYEHIMQHTVIGHRILAPLLKTLPQALAIVRSHHERLDGDGFPDGLKGDEIPVHVRVVSVVDSFDAMTTGRPYRPGLSAAAAIRELESHQGAQFDPDVVAAFLAAYPDRSCLPIATPAAGRIDIPQTSLGAGVPLLIH